MPFVSEGVWSYYRRTTLIFPSLNAFRTPPQTGCVLGRPMSHAPGIPVSTPVHLVFTVGFKPHPKVLTKCPRMA
jgi:hypothetical protein